MCKVGGRSTLSCPEYGEYPLCDMQYVMQGPGGANAIYAAKYAMGRANAIRDMRIRYGPREYDIRYANRLRAMSNCKVATILGSFSTFSLHKGV